MTTQREFLMGLTATLTLVIAVPAGDAFAQRGGKSQGSYDDPQCDVTVTGTNSAPVDSDAINTAVNGAGLPSDATVCLEGTFEFGESQFVSIIADPLVERLRITGIDGATILFGIQPLRLLPGSDLDQLTIDHIRFVRPSITAVSIFDGLELVQISDNVVDGVQTAEVPALGVSLREGIVVSSASVDIGGKVVITDNWVDAGVYTVSDFDFNHVNAGIGAFGPVVGGGGLDAEVVISGNTVLNWAGSGIQVIANEGETLIERNVVEPGIVANNLPVACVANGAGKPEILALVSRPTDGELTWPCGACLQVALELGGDDLIVAVSDGDQIETRQLSELAPNLPHKH